MTADGLRKWEVVYSQISLCGLKTFIVCCSSQSPVWFFVTPWTAARQASLAFTISWSLLRFMPLGWWCYLTISSSATLFFCLQSFLASESFPWVSSSHQVAQVLELHHQHQPSSEYSGLISLRIDWFELLGSQESSPTSQFKSINSLALSFVYSLALTSICDYWKNHSFD